jgi:hypothetical protein
MSISTMCMLARSACAPAFRSTLINGHWSCGFYPGLHPGQHKAGAAAEVFRLFPDP